ncbi:uncharacterized protein N7458_006275 [Penicillium daleae]|uniref:Uncharacterized protein n=1 Tax=Penicillium daleae TaxID=63821 RepID=A0AAD6C5S8_9EURO|nr:uncharacterized protein N7458_006275 [Penicillium daleae]KAJ5449826.1 hypothetical protein N7458_006275 [Penicillium daleae]
MSSSWWSHNNSVKVFPCGSDSVSFCPIDQKSNQTSHIPPDDAPSGPVSSLRTTSPRGPPLPRARIAGLAGLRWGEKAHGRAVFGQQRTTTGDGQRDGGLGILPQASSD